MNDGISRIPYALSGIAPAFAVCLWQVYLAAQTRTLSRYIVLAASIGTVLVLLLFFGVFSGESSINLRIGVLPSSLHLHQALWIQTVTMACVGTGVLFFMYKTRHILASWLLVAVATFVALLMRPGSSIEETFSFDGEEYLMLETIRKGGTFYSDSEELVQIIAVFNPFDVPGDVDVWGTVHNASIRSGDEELRLEEYPYIQRLQKQNDGLLSIVIGNAPKKEVEALGTSVTAEFSQNLTFSRQVEMDTLPLEQGAVYRHDGDRLAVQSYYQSSSELRVSLGKSIPTFTLEPDDRPQDPDSLEEPLEGKYSFALATSKGERLRDFNLSYAPSDLSSLLTNLGASTSVELGVPIEQHWQPDDHSIIVYRRTITETAFSFFSEETSLER